MNLQKIFDSVDYKKCVELIDNGYLLHATNNEFDKFDSSYIKGGNREKEGYGFYFTDMAYKVQEYGDKLIAVKKDDFYFFDYNKPISNKKLFNRIFPTISIASLEEQLLYANNYSEYNNTIFEIEDLKGRSYNEEYDNEFVSLAFKHQDWNYGQLWNNAPIVNGKSIGFYFVERLLDNGYDGCVFDGIYTIFNFDKLNNRFKFVKK